MITLLNIIHNMKMEKFILIKNMSNSIKKLRSTTKNIKQKKKKKKIMKRKTETKRIKIKIRRVRRRRKLPKIYLRKRITKCMHLLFNIMKATMYLSKLKVVIFGHHQPMKKESKALLL